MDTVSIGQTHRGDTDPSTMLKTVYFLIDHTTGRRIRYYRTLTGARIAQRARNSRLGFEDRVERVELADNLEVEQCSLADGTVVTATYAIQEDTVEQWDLE